MQEAKVLKGMWGLKSQEEIGKDLLQAISWTIGLRLNAGHFQLPCVQLHLIYIRQNENIEAQV